MKMNEEELKKEFHAISCGETFLGGHLPKGFYWVDGELPKHQSFSRYTGTVAMRDLAFGELVTSVKRGVPYQVYFNHSICGNKANGSIPKNILCLIKEMNMTNNNSEVYGEIVGCRLAARLGLNTVYNVAYTKHDERDLLDQNCHNYMLSVNYVPCGGTVFDLGELGKAWDRGTSLKEIFEYIDIELPRYLEQQGVEVTPKMINRFKRDFGEHWLFRVMLCGDSDFEEHNALATIMPDGTLVYGPNADTEYFFDSRSKRYEDITQEGMLFLQEIMPRMVDSFMIRLNDAYLDGSINDIMSRPNIISDWHKRNKIKILNENRRHMFSLWRQNKHIIAEKEREAATE